VNFVERRGCREGREVVRWLVRRGLSRRKGAPTKSRFKFRGHWHEPRPLSLVAGRKGQARRPGSSAPLALFGQPCGAVLR